MPFWTFLAFVLAGSAAPEKIYAAGRAAYAAKEYDRADEMFRLLLHEPPPVSTPARFALANTLVQRARATDSVGPTGNMWLREAIDHYRMLLDAGVGAPLREEDIRCNLAIAKRSLNWLKSSGDEAKSNADAERESATDSNGSTPAASTEKPKRPASVKSSRSADDKGEVLSPSAGIPFVDPGPISRAAAEQQIAERVRRLEQDAKEKSTTPPVSRTRSKDDY